MKLLFLLPFLLGFSVPAFPTSVCPKDVLKEGKVGGGSATYCRTSNYRWHQNHSCKCPNTGFKPDLTADCLAYAQIDNVTDSTTNISNKYNSKSAPYEVLTCYDPN